MNRGDLWCLAESDAEADRLLTAPRRRLALAGAGLFLAATLLGACSNGAAEKAQAKTPAAREAAPVTIETAVSKSLPVQIQAVGSVQAYAVVTIKSQVDGEVARVHFTEGQEVKKGDLLFTLDQRPFEAMLQQAEANLARDTAQLEQAEAAVAQNMAAEKQAEANLARDTAQLENAMTQVRRYKGLIEEGAISNELYDQVRTNATALEATIQADQAAVTNTRAMIRAAQATVQNVRAAMKADQAMVANARVQLGYTTIRAPMDGRAGNLLVRVGSAVKARDDTGAMVVINQIHPIYVSFSVSEQSLPDIKKYLKAGSLRVQAVPRGQDGSPVTGQLTFVNNTVDATTGTIQLKATFSNQEGALWPGQFVTAVVTLTVQPDLVVVPSQAIQTGQQGQYVYVMRSDSTVESRPVTVGRTLGGEAVVAKGLVPGEKVVTDGQLRLAPGSRVQVKTPVSSASGQAQ
ncbi:MAG TPA: efflux RND transporter periplasmic adaptor subunit [Candidatus Methylomirabilis sp.]|nr:efflux RND transporter periplasmic adaptor subunit [Candidatus Methylomirabilis sp.]